ncbi:hypothetical protein EKD16_05240 [Streptomonospora litoralis]|uniref:Uncharacterized protein n=1 Tax=Streptomonospora litoralis TaxID=2498135 RepID=A0A4P6Q274_9ACTN|nr:hypothetical protein EKD16_05240 [Streptomonospora litoralis]
MRLVATAPAEAARKTGIGSQKSTSSGSGAVGGRAWAQRATCCRSPAPDPAHHRAARAPATAPRRAASGRCRPDRNMATPSRPTGAGRSPMPVHPAMTANLWPRNTLTCDHKFTIDGPSRAESVSRAGFGAESSPGDRLDGTGAAQRRVLTRQRPRVQGVSATPAPHGGVVMNTHPRGAAPAGRRNRRAPVPMSAGLAPLPPSPPRRPPSPASTRPDGHRPSPSPSSAPLFRADHPPPGRPTRPPSGPEPPPPLAAVTGEHPTRWAPAQPFAVLGAAFPCRPPATRQADKAAQRT